MNDVRTYECENCHNVYEMIEDEDWSTEKALAEYQENFPTTSQIEDGVLVCDTCYTAMIAWMPPAMWDPVGLKQMLTGQEP